MSDPVVDGSLWVPENFIEVRDATWPDPKKFMDLVGDEAMKPMVHNPYLFHCLKELSMEKRIEWVVEARERKLHMLAGKIAEIGLKPGRQITLGATNDTYYSMPEPMRNRMFE